MIEFLHERRTEKKVTKRNVTTKKILKKISIEKKNPRMSSITIFYCNEKVKEGSKITFLEATLFWKHLQNDSKRVIEILHEQRIKKEKRETFICYIEEHCKNICYYKDHRISCITNF